MNDYEEAIQTMCRRCINHQLCMGTGCTPKNQLVVLKENYDHLLDDFTNQYGDLQKYQEALDKACDIIDNSRDCPLAEFDIDFNCEKRCEDSNPKECWKDWCLKDE